MIGTGPLSIYPESKSELLMPHYWICRYCELKKKIAKQVLKKYCQPDFADFVEKQIFRISFLEALKKCPSSVK
jgi:hypothetical protein